MKNAKKYLSLSVMTLACIGASQAQTSNNSIYGYNEKDDIEILASGYSSSDSNLDNTKMGPPHITSQANTSPNGLVMYRGLVMTPAEYQRQKNFENGLQHSSQNERLMVGYSEDISYDSNGTPYAYENDNTQFYNTVRVIPTSEKVQRSLPLTREEVINEYIRAKNAGELNYYEEVLYRN